MLVPFSKGEVSFDKKHVPPFHALSNIRRWSTNVTSSLLKLPLTGILGWSVRLFNNQFLSSVEMSHRTHALDHQKILARFNQKFSNILLIRHVRMRSETLFYFSEEEMSVIIVGNFAGGTKKRFISRHHVARCHNDVFQKVSR